MSNPFVFVIKGENPLFRKQKGLGLRGQERPEQTKQPLLIRLALRIKPELSTVLLSSRSVQRLIPTGVSRGYFVLKAYYESSLENVWPLATGGR